MIVLYRIVTLRHQYGEASFTDLSVEWRGEVYGSRHLGVVSRAEAQALADLVCRRNT